MKIPSIYSAREFVSGLKIGQVRVRVRVKSYGIAVHFPTEV